ncbi:polysaccharide deacetylase family protein [Paratissierella segnis]|jgi:polysaccharide deacetylase family sporulation protein PdaB|uniref:Polysaccharide deacetylase family protein n=1 Tax=Paratissierella segnis TaxID=2763679 RepID=A0A926EVP8_9FIRM|nr:polysaccharide deacetylase family protein [Paratissierella segnis]MBC8589385.1 polysaccharide deacetylase family protein [Paratissierella segnis]
MKRYNNSHFTLRIGIVLSILFVGMLVLFIENNVVDVVFSPKKELPIYSVDRDDKKIAISFDAAWGNEFTGDILDTLDKYNIKSTFFLVGFWVDKYPEDVKEIVSRGHEIGNHSTNHPDMTKLSKEQMTSELTTTEEKIFKLTSTKPILFRPPFGAYNDSVIQVARELGYFPIQWDIDSLDWKELGVEPVIDRVVKNVRSGSIVLFHNNAKYIKEYLPIVIERVQAKGFEIVPISELIYRDNFEMDNTGRQIYLK